MSLLLQETQCIRTLLFPILGETQVKTFFSYYAIFKDGIMFGLYKQGDFYLRLSPPLHARYSWTASLTPLTAPRSGIYDRHFYHIPDHLFATLANCPDLLVDTVQDIANAKQENIQARQKLIRSLPNLNIHIERQLRRLAIFTIEELCAKGEVAIFIEMLKRGMSVDRNLLFKLHGAIHRKNVYLLSAQQKQELLAELNSALYDAGLRQRF